MDPTLKGEPTVISCPINLQGAKVKVSLNIDGTTSSTPAKVEMLTEEFQSIPTSGARDLEAFTIAGALYLAVANKQNKQDKRNNSKESKLQPSLSS